MLDLSELDPVALRHWFAAEAWNTDSPLANLVTNAHGEFWDSQNSSRGLSNHTDLQALVGYRMASDVVLTTAKTARLEQYRRTSASTLAIYSSTGNFDSIPAVNDVSSDLPLILITDSKRFQMTADAYASVSTSVLELPVAAPTQALSALADLGFAKVLIEAGPSFIRELIQAQALQFVALSFCDTTGINPDNFKVALNVLGVDTAKLVWHVRHSDTYFTMWSIT